MTAAGADDDEDEDEDEDSGTAEATRYCATVSSCSSRNGITPSARSVGTKSANSGARVCGNDGNQKKIENEKVKRIEMREECEHTGQGKNKRSRCG